MRLTIVGRPMAEFLLGYPHTYSHLVSITDERPIKPRFKVRRSLQLAFHDLTIPRLGYVAPGVEHVQAIIDFGVQLLADVADPAQAAPEVLCHCEMGLSRSTAAAFILTALSKGPGREVAALDEVLGLREHADPNVLMVELADRLMGREGKMEAALSAFRRARLEAAWAKQRA